MGGLQEGGTWDLDPNSWLQNNTLHRTSFLTGPVSMHGPVPTHPFHRTKCCDPFVTSSFQMMSQ